MAHKRVIRVTSRPPKEEAKEEEETWAQWAKRSYVRAWYILLCLFIDAFVALEVINGGTGLAWGLGAIAILVLIMGQVFIYLKLWGRGGRWHVD